MRNIFSFKKEEKVVLLVGTLIIIGVITGGTLKAKFVKEEPYVPKDIPNVEQLSSSITIKQDIFKVLANSELDKQPNTYVKVNSGDLASVKLDFSKVNMQKVGKYNVDAILGNESKAFIIEVVESKNPVIKVVNPNFQFILEDNSTMNEVKEYAKATAKDSEGTDISDKITGWADTLPIKERTITYTLVVKDAQGISGSQKVVVQYLIKKEAAKQ